MTSNAYGERDPLTALLGCGQVVGKGLSKWYVLETPAGFLYLVTQCKWQGCPSEGASEVIGCRNLDLKCGKACSSGAKWAKGASVMQKWLLGVPE